jgi:hypothetical protein
VPWLLDGVSSSISGIAEAQAVMDGTLAATLALADARKQVKP